MKDELLTPPEAGNEFGISTSTLAHWRSEGYGPDYIRMGRHIRYRRSALEAWIDANTTSATKGEEQTTGGETRVEVEVSTTVRIDPALWASEYGISESEVAEDVARYYEQILWQLAEEFNRTGAHRI